MDRNTDATGMALSSTPTRHTTLCHDMAHTAMRWTATARPKSHVMGRSPRNGVRRTPHVAVRAGALVEVTDDTWDQEVLQADKPVLVDFWATWCGPCKLIGPIVTQISEEYGDKLKVVKFNCTEKTEMRDMYRVFGLPCLIMFKDGQEIPGSRKEGLLTLNACKDLVEKSLLAAAEL